MKETALVVNNKQQNLAFPTVKLPTSTKHHLRLAH